MSDEKDQERLNVRFAAVWEALEAHEVTLRMLEQEVAKLQGWLKRHDYDLK